MGVSKKSRLATSLLSYFLGFYGVDLFYIGKTGMGILQIISTVLCYAFIIISAIITFVGSATIVLLILALILDAIGLGLCVWPVVRMIMTLCGKTKDANGDIISQWIIKND